MPADLISREQVAAPYAAQRVRAQVPLAGVAAAVAMTRPGGEQKYE